MTTFLKFLFMIRLNDNVNSNGVSTTKINKRMKAVLVKEEEAPKENGSFSHVPQM